MTRFLLALLSVLLLPLQSQAQAASPWAADPRSGVDLITQVNALALGCRYACTVHIPAGDYTVRSGTILVHHNGLSIVGDGRNNTIIHYAGLNFLDSRLDASTYGPSFSGSGLIGGFTVYCTNPNVRCITAGSVIGQRWQDITLVGPGTITGSPPPGATAEGFTLQNTFDWMERTVFRDITLGGFTSNFHFLAPKGGTDSFGYLLFDGIWTNQGPRSRNFVVDAGAGVYNILGFTMQFNSGATTTRDEVFSIAGAFTGVGFHVTGENAGAPITFAHIACGGHMIFEGDYNVFGGEAVADCAETKRDTGDAFRVTPVAGLAGVRGSTAGNPILANTTDVGLTPAQSFTLWPYEEFNRSNPYANAWVGYAGNQNGRVSPISVFDPDVPWCVAARGIYTGSGQIEPRLCLNGAGDLATAGSVRGTTLRTTRGTPKSSHDACTPGDSWDDDNFHYHCASSGQIKRLALQPF